ncbi:MAG TPA: hypothetical protein V6C65_34880 [Allocoleopsis sp.]
MAQAISAITKFRGIIDNLVFTNGDKLGPRVRKRPRVNVENNDVKFKEQSGRAIVVNKLASEINQVIRQRYATFKGSDFYQKLVRCFRRQSSDNRYMLLRQIVGMDIDPRYPMENQGKFTAKFIQEVHQLSVEMKTVEHPPNPLGEKCNQYRYKLLLLIWTGHGDGPLQQRQKTEWVPLEGPKNIFDFVFRFPEATAQWLLIIRSSLGLDGKENPTKPAQAVHIYEAGSLLEEDLRLVGVLSGNERAKKKEENDDDEDDEPVVKARGQG